MSSRTVPQSFIDAMNTQLELNKEKGGWQYEPSVWLVCEAMKNICELQRAIHAPCAKEQAEIIKRRSANVANFAMMIYDKMEKYLPGSSDKIQKAEPHDRTVDGIVMACQVLVVHHGETGRAAEILKCLCNKEEAMASQLSSEIHNEVMVPLINDTFKDA